MNIVILIASLILGTFMQQHMREYCYLLKQKGNVFTKQGFFLVQSYISKQICSGLRLITLHAKCLACFQNSKQHYF